MCTAMMAAKLSVCVSCVLLSVWVCVVAGSPLSPREPFDEDAHSRSATGRRARSRTHEAEGAERDSFSTRTDANDGLAEPVSNSEFAKDSHASRDESIHNADEINEKQSDSASERYQRARAKQSSWWSGVQDWFGLSHADTKRVSSEPDEEPRRGRTDVPQRFGKDVTREGSWNSSSSSHGAEESGRTTDDHWVRSTAELQRQYNSHEDPEDKNDGMFDEYKRSGAFVSGRMDGGDTDSRLGDADTSGRGRGDHDESSDDYGKELTKTDVQRMIHTFHSLFEALDRSVAPPKHEVADSEADAATVRRQIEESLSEARHPRNVDDLDDSASTGSTHRRPWARTTSRPRSLRSQSARNSEQEDSVDDRDAARADDPHPRRRPRKGMALLAPAERADDSDDGNDVEDPDGEDGFNRRGQGASGKPSRRLMNQSSPFRELVQSWLHR